MALLILGNWTAKPQSVRLTFDNPALARAPATDLADYLVHRGVPFRQSHGLVGRAVRRAEALGLPLRELPLAEFRAISDTFDSDLYVVFDHRRSVEARDSYGGTATAAVRQQIERAWAVLRKPGLPNPR